MKVIFLVCLLVSLSLLSTSEARPGLGEEDSPVQNLFDAIVARARARDVPSTQLNVVNGRSWTLARAPTASAGACLRMRTRARLELQ